MKREPSSDLAPPNFQLPTRDKLEAAIKAHRDLLTPKTRDALIARWNLASENEQSAINTMLDSTASLLEDDKAQAFAAFFKGLRFRTNQKFDDTIRQMQIASTHFKKLMEHHWEATSLLNVGYAYLHKGEHDKAIEYYEKSLAIQCAELGERHLRSP